MNLGAGPGHLDEILLTQFTGAQATLVDGSMAMLAAARDRLVRFGDRVEFVAANLSTPDWVNAVQGPFDVAVSTIALHNLGDPRRLRALYGEIYGILGHGGLFVNLDYVRIARASLIPLAAWAAHDPEAGFTGARGGAGLPGTVGNSSAGSRKRDSPPASASGRNSRWRSWQASATTCTCLGARKQAPQPQRRMPTSSGRD